MDIKSVVEEFLVGRRYRITKDSRGTQVVLPYCPFCGGGEHKDKNTFTINYNTGLYSCYRGTCGESGNIYTLIKKMDLSKAKEVLSVKRKHRYSPPKIKGDTLSIEAKNWLLKRKISIATADKYGVKSRCNPKNGKQEVVFVYTRNNKPVFVKTRGLIDKTIQRDKGTEPILYLMDYCDDRNRLYITEGECDALILKQHDPKLSVVSIPSGTKDGTWIDTCWEFLEEFKEIVLIGDNDEAGYDFMDVVGNKLKAIADVYLADYDGFEFKDDINDIYLREGRDGLDTLLSQIENIPNDEFTDLADIEYVSQKDRIAIPSSFKTINQLWGGYGLHEITVLTGSNNTGKSTMLGMEILTARENDYITGVLSGEQSDEEYKAWITSMCAGKDNLTENINSFGETFYTVNPNVIGKINEWLRGYVKLFNIGDRRITASQLIETIKLGYNRYGINNWVIDNLATIKFDNKGDTLWQKQQEFINDLGQVVKSDAYPIHVMLVVHQGKGRNAPSKGAVDGAKQITDLVHNSIGIMRADRESIGELEREHDVSYQHLVDCDGALVLLKHRATGIIKKAIGTMYDKHTRRTYQLTDKSVLNHKFGWEDFENDEIPF